MVSRIRYMFGIRTFLIRVDLSLRFASSFDRTQQESKTRSDFGNIN